MTNGILVHSLFVIVDKDSPLVMEENAVISETTVSDVKAEEHSMLVSGNVCYAPFVVVLLRCWVCIVIR